MNKGSCFPTPNSFLPLGVFAPQGMGWDGSIAVKIAKLEGGQPLSLYGRKWGIGDKDFRFYERIYGKFGGIAGGHPSIPGDVKRNGHCCFWQIYDSIFSVAEFVQLLLSIWS